MAAERIWSPSGRRLGVLERLAEFLHHPVVLALDQRVPGGDDHGDGPFDDLQRDQRAQRTEVGKLFGTRNQDAADNRQVDRESLRFADLVDRALAPGFDTRSIIGHWLPSSHGVLGIQTPAGTAAGDMSSPGVVASSDPLTDVIARLLAVPLRELYAVLWRAGLVEIVD